MQTKPEKSESINIVTLGCSKNVVDSEFLMKQIDSNHVRVVHNADSFRHKTVIINTCGFIQDAKLESINTILKFIKAKENGLIRQVFVMGCLSERYKKDLEKEIPDVDKYFGANNISGIITHLGLNYKKDLIGERLLSTPSHYAYFKISEGCDRQCAFCAIPIMRGNHISTPVEMLRGQATSLAASGVKELILIAQDLSWYGLDLYKKQALPELLENLSDIPGIEWIRLHYMYPAGFPKDVLRIMKERPNICKYIDIPFQHASDKVLTMMRRNHTARHDRDLIDYIRREVPGITLRTTLITGHPGEGDAEFEDLRKFVEEMRFDRLGVFAYSEEEDTWAAEKYKDDIPEEVKKQRAGELMKLQQGISEELNRQKVGQSMRVLIDSHDDQYFYGRSEADSPEVDNEILIARGEKKLKTGHFYTIRITGAEEFDLYGTPEKM
jgi:ribosomal protein S12 methylthiotransferase